MTKAITETTTNKVHQGYEYSNFFHLTNDFAGYIDFEGILFAEGDKEVKAIVTFVVHELMPNAGLENDHCRPAFRAYMTFREQQYIDGANIDLAEPRCLSLTVEAAKEILRTWGQTIYTV